MDSSRQLTALLLCGIMLITGCSRSNEVELAKARADADAARAEATKARAEADAAKAALPKPPAVAAGLRVWRDTEAEDFCKWLAIEADCYKFDGGWVDCWVEIDVGGKKTRLESAAPLHQPPRRKMLSKIRSSVSHPARSFGSGDWTNRKHGYYPSDSR